MQPPGNRNGRHRHNSSSQSDKSSKINTPHTARRARRTGTVLDVCHYSIFPSRKPICTKLIPQYSCTNRDKEMSSLRCMCPRLMKYIDRWRIPSKQSPAYCSIAWLLQQCRPRSVHRYVLFCPASPMNPTTKVHSCMIVTLEPKQKARKPKRRLGVYVTVRYPPKQKKKMKVRRQRKKRIANQKSEDQPNQQSRPALSPADPSNLDGAESSRNLSQAKLKSQASR
ncbi:hypothetical protein N656DRAFT_525531 [Canariomyces notabilis]|uniref:Uncharacterized protein n=1 Tax=Canariomyces notabilis TaxID=2074819 RepID=A0AAN6T7R7_9PEZI|nr:hypothetical protein N656DRAFT_525531 [Canariomyces arenarius]